MASASASSVSEALKRVICGHLVVAKLDLVEIDSKESVSDAVDLMQAHHIQSVPVYDQGHRRYIGTVAMYDVAMFLVKNRKGGETIDADDLSLLKNTTVRKLIGLYREAQTGSRSGGLLGVQAATPLTAVLKPLSEGTPRILVALGFVKTDPSKPLFRLLSATDVVSYLTAQMEQFPTVTSRSVESSMSKDILVRKLSDKTFEAFTALSEMAGDALALAVVDDAGVLVTTLSVSDLRNLEAVGQLGQSVEDFLKARNFGALRDPVAVKTTDTVGDAMRKATSAHIHRVWVVDGDNKPIGAVRLCDIVRCFHEA